MSGQAEAVFTRPPQTAPARKRRTHWIVAALVLLFLLNAFLLPLISLGRYHRTIADTLSRSLGHTVHIGSVNLAIFPLPGLVIHDLTVEEDPAFGAEPILRAPQVTVFLRVSSLWTDRLEISRINLDNASVNLDRDSVGRWNFSSLLLQASRANTAPTAQRRRTVAPRFPYIEFTGARINFKEGAEKKSLSFLNADASVWLADPSQWRIRFEAQPARTDLALSLGDNYQDKNSDRGTIRLDGSLTRAASLEKLPLNLHVEWTGAQLGQVTRLLFGSDSGWRGDLQTQADLSGNIDDLTLHSQLRVIGVHRVEFTPINPLDIDTRCQATYHHATQLFDNLTCLLPTGDGHLLLTGSIANSAHPEPRLTLEINHTPVAFVAGICGLLRSSLNSTLTASGTINGQFTWAQPVELFDNKREKSPENEDFLTGHAVAENVSLKLAGSDQPIAFAALRFTTPSEGLVARPEHTGHTRISQARNKKKDLSAFPANNPSYDPANGPGLTLEPANFAAGVPTPMQVSGQFTRSGFTLHFTGKSSLERLQPIARDFAQLHGLYALTATSGIAESDITFTGPWLPPINTETGANVPAAIQGWTRLQHAVIKPAWLPEPVEIISATAQLSPNSITWNNASIAINGIAAKGSVSYATTCVDPAGCPAELTLDFTTLNAAALQSVILGADHGEFLQAILSTVESPAPPWPALNGTIHAATLTIGTLRFTNARAAVTIHNNLLNILSLDASTLGGITHITGSVEPSSDGPQYALNLTAAGINLREAAAMFHEDWGAGSVNGQVALNLHGYSDLAASATGDFRFALTGNWGGNWITPETTESNPSLLNASEAVPPNSPNPVSSTSVRKSAHQPQWIAAGTIANQTLTFTNGPASGTIAFDRSLNLDWTTNAPSGPAPTAALPEPQPELGETSADSQVAPSNTTLHITGTLTQPVAQPINQPPATSSTAKRPNKSQNN